MAKRKRLSAADPSRLSLQSEAGATGGAGRVRAPISEVAGETAASAALQTLADEMKEARASGRMILSIPIAQVEADYLVRDRVVTDAAEMQSLKDSLAARGQQTAIEVVQLAPERYGLISGWRRLTAMRQLLSETGDAERFGQMQVVLRTPEGATDAYLSMVEENEIRVGLSYYERARIAAKAVEQGVFETEKQALLSLFSAASRAKRSKIRSFLSIYHALDETLHFAGSIPERLGLRLAKALDADSALAGRLADALATARPASAEEEAAVIEGGLKPAAGSGAAKTPAKTPAAARPGPVELTETKSGLQLKGPGVDAAFKRRLRAWIAAGAPQV